MRVRTITQPNGKGDVREMYFGMDVIAPVAGFVVAAFAAWLSLRLEVQEIKTIQSEDNDHLHTIIQQHVEQYDDSKQFVTRSELDRAMVGR